MHNYSVFAKTIYLALFALILVSCTKGKIDRGTSSDTPSSNGPATSSIGRGITSLQVSNQPISKDQFRFKVENGVPPYTYKIETELTSTAFSYISPEESGDGYGHVTFINAEVGKKISIMITDSMEQKVTANFIRYGTGDFESSETFNPTLISFPSIKKLEEHTNAMISQADGKILMVGYFNLEGLGYPVANIYRLNNDGSLDSSFISVAERRAMQPNGSPALIEENAVYNAALMQGTKILAAGYKVVNNVKQLFVARYLPNGGLDPEFGTNGYILGDPNLVSSIQDDSYQMTKDTVTTTITQKITQFRGDEANVLQLRQGGQVGSSLIYVTGTRTLEGTRTYHYEDSNSANSPNPDRTDSFLESNSTLVWFGENGEQINNSTIKQGTSNITFKDNLGVINDVSELLGGADVKLSMESRGFAFQGSSNKLIGFANANLSLGLPKGDEPGGFEYLELFSPAFARWNSDGSGDSTFTRGTKFLGFVSEIKGAVLPYWFEGLDTIGSPWSLGAQNSGIIAPDDSIIGAGYSVDFDLIGAMNEQNNIGNSLREAQANNQTKKKFTLFCFLPDGAADPRCNAPGVTLSRGIMTIPVGDGKAQASAILATEKLDELGNKQIEKLIMAGLAEKNGASVLTLVGLVQQGSGASARFVLDSSLWTNGVLYKEDRVIAETDKVTIATDSSGRAVVTVTSATGTKFADRFWIK